MEPRGVEDSHRVLVTATDASDVASSLDDVATVEIRPPSALDGNALADADCFVVADPEAFDALPATVDVPVIVYGCEPDDELARSPIADAFAADPSGLRTQVEWILGHEEDDRIRRSTAAEPTRTERLHEGAAELTGVRTDQEAYETAVAVAEEVLSVHSCTMAVVEEPWIRPVAVSSNHAIDECEEVRVGDGIAGEVYSDGEPRLDRDLADEELSGDYRSAITVPVGDRAVFQAVSLEPDDFDRTDLELAELLASHLAETLHRIRAEADLREERDRLVALFENVPDAAVHFEYVEGEPIVRRINTAFETVFGVDADEIVGETLDDYIVPSNPDAEAEAAELNEMMRAGKNVRREVKRLTDDGIGHFLLHVIPVHLDAQNISGYAIYTDVTEHREREAQLRRQNERLDQFASIVSHDLRNPLSVAAGYLELARETGDPAQLDRVGDALDRMEELVDELLMLAREGAVIGERTAEPLADLANRAWENVETPDASLETVEDCTLEVDRDRTLELLENLFRNAVEHGGRDVAVRVGLLEGGATPAGFYVADDGAGIPAEARDVAFEPGYTTGDGGTGLGLAIVESVAEAHGWTVRIADSEAGGARFEFETGPESEVATEFEN